MSSGETIGVSNGTNGAQGSLEQMNANLVAIANEQKLSGSGVIQNKFHDHQQGKEYSFTFKDNMLLTNNGIHRANFIVGSSGELHIGNGHSYMANGKAVKAAGTIKVNSKGAVRRVTNLSGHYQPNVEETVHYLNQMYLDGYITNKTWVEIYKFDKTKSGYVSKSTIVYSGPYQYMNRRFSK